MKINAFDPKTTAAAVSPAAGDKRAPTATPVSDTGGVEASAKVKLSATATQMGTEAGSFDQAKVDRIRQQIESGSFKPNAGAIADQLIANAQELLGGSKA